MEKKTRLINLAIWGIEGGIGTGKTITGVALMLGDLFKGKTIYSNVMLKNIPARYKKNITYMTKDNLNNIFMKIKRKEWNMINSTVFIQEAHNYMDSRNFASDKNKVLSYWILQSRHTGEGSCDIIYDTQELSQVDRRLRRNTDYVIHPTITEFEIINNIKKPKTIHAVCYVKQGQKTQKFNMVLDVSQTRELYNTHELVDF